MRIWRPVARFLAGDDGFVISTEKVLVLTLVLCALVVGVLSLRDALQNYFLDEVDAIAACSNQFVFDPGEVQIMTTTDFTTLFPNLTTQVERPEPTPATKESQ